MGGSFKKKRMAPTTTHIHSNMTPTQQEAQLK
jgi:hypothetical protein